MLHNNTWHYDNQHNGTLYDSTWDNNPRHKFRCVIMPSVVMLQKVTWHNDALQK
jgi:hypothetical protein